VFRDVTKCAAVALPQFFQTIEETGLSTWARDTPFWVIISIHAIGMTLLVGASAAFALRIFGVARDLPLAPLRRLYGIIWAGFWVQVASGGLLLIAYPTKSLTNPYFYVKLALIGLAMFVMERLKRRVFGDAGLSEPDMMANGRALAAWSILLWLGAVAAGRILAYTYTYVSYAG